MAVIAYSCPPIQMRKMSNGSPPLAFPSRHKAQRPMSRCTKCWTYGVGRRMIGHRYSCGSTGCSRMTAQKPSTERILCAMTPKLVPPISIHERRTVRPSPRHVWVGGYHRYEGNAYVRTPGRWDVPPRAHAVWVAPRYERRHDGYVFIEGRWR